jgi:hypothetical protein
MKQWSKGNKNTRLVTIFERAVSTEIGPPKRFLLGVVW